MEAGSRERERPPRRRRRREPSGPTARFLTALPLIAFAIFIVANGGLIWALGLIVLGVFALRELYTMMRRVRPIDVAGFLTLVALVLAALYGDEFQILLVLMASVPLSFALAVVRPWRQHVSWAIAATVLGVVWIAVPMAHAVLLRELDHGGGLVVDVLIGTFIGDTAAYFGGRAWGRSRIAPQISPNKTLEGLVAGIVGGTLAFWGFAIAYQDFISGVDALVIGLCVALAAPAGDLFESLLKRDLEVKDAGRVFGPHGGVLDRIDGALFSVVVGYYACVAVL